MVSIRKTQKHFDRQKNITQKINTIDKNIKKKYYYVLHGSKKQHIFAKK